jgi:hypothetical protein
MSRRDGSFAPFLGPISQTARLNTHTATKIVPLAHPIISASLARKLNNLLGNIDTLKSERYFNFTGKLMAESLTVVKGCHHLKLWGNNVIV